MNVILIIFKDENYPISKKAEKTRKILSKLFSKWRNGYISRSSYVISAITEKGFAIFGGLVFLYDKKALFYAVSKKLRKKCRFFSPSAGFSETQNLLQKNEFTIMKTIFCYKY